MRYEMVPYLSSAVGWTRHYRKHLSSAGNPNTRGVTHLLMLLLDYHQYRLAEQWSPSPFSLREFLASVSFRICEVLLELCEALHVVLHHRWSTFESEVALKPGPS